MCFIGCFLVIAASCERRLQQISAQMDLIATRRRGVTVLIRSGSRGSSGLAGGSLSDSTSGLNGPPLSPDIQGTVLQLPVSPAQALLQANRSNASIAGEAPPSNNEALPPDHQLLAPPTTTIHDGNNSPRSVHLGLLWSAVTPNKPY